MFYDRFIELCRERGKSAAAVVREIGLNNSAPTTWKRGAIPKGETLQKLADYFDVSTDYLLGTRTRQNRPTLNVGNTYLDGAMRIEEIDESNNKLQVKFSVETDELSIDDLQALVDCINRLSKEHKITVSGLTQIADAVITAFGGAPSASQNDLDTILSSSTPKTPPGGKGKAAEAVEVIAGNPRYRAETAPESTPAPQEGKDTTPPPNAPETAPEGE